MQQASPLRELTCHMRSHSVTCHPAEVTFQPLPQRDARLSWSKHCSRVAQPLLKASYRSGCGDKHKRPRWDSNLCPHTSVAPANHWPLRPRHVQSQRKQNNVCGQDHALEVKAKAIRPTQRPWFWHHLVCRRKLGHGELQSHAAPWMTERCCHLANSTTKRHVLPERRYYKL